MSELMHDQTEILCAFASSNCCTRDTSFLRVSMTARLADAWRSFKPSVNSLSNDDVLNTNPAFCKPFCYHFLPFPLLLSKEHGPRSPIQLTILRSNFLMCLYN
jgi:hypothetical protein